MKKILSLILAVIMLLSVMPVAYAKPATYSPEIEQYIEAYVRAITYAWSVYETPEQKSEAFTIIDEATKNVVISVDHDDLVNIEADGRLEELNASYECFKKGIDEIEKKIADGKLVIVIDLYEVFIKYYWYIDIYYSHKDWSELKNRAEKFKSDKYINTRSELEIGLDVVDNIMNFDYDIHATAPTQADLDAAMEKIKPHFDLFIACLDGNHPYGEYVSNNDATEEADGTKTATCEFCGLNNTITDEGTKLPKEEASLLEMIFDLIKDFFELIFSIFA